MMTGVCSQALVIRKSGAMYEVHGDDADRINDVCKTGFTLVNGKKAVRFNFLGLSVYTKKLDLAGIEYIIK